MKNRDLHLSGVRSLFLAMAATLVVSLILTYVVGNEVLRSSERLSVHEGITRQVQQAFSTLQDAETGQRGFLMTQRDEYLEPYREALDDIGPRLRRLQAAAESGRLSPELSANFQRLARAKISEMARTIEIANRGDFPAAIAIVNGDDGKQTMDEIRDVLVAVASEEKRQRDEIQRDARWLTSLRNATFVLMGLANLAFLGWAYGRIRREMSRRYVADLEAQRQRDVLAVSLASIGDAVIITDTHAQITYLNDVAVELTGWPLEAALGQNCSKVFRIIHETTRAAVENPVDVVLKTGKVVGLANHTLLIRRDGSEVPIDDSGAPVREADGALRGVILVFRDFSGYKAAERAQAELQTRLEVANHAKDDFIAALSHELRTPLTPVLATLSAWESTANLPEAVAAEVKMLNRNVRLEARLIDDLLDLTKIARGEMMLHCETVDVHGLLTAAVEIFRGDLERRQVRLGVRMSAARHFVEGDPTRLQQVFWNLLANAAKFSPDGGRIEIVTTEENGTLRILFADNGRGMSPETISALFRPFERAAGQRAYQAGGLGVGLTISQNLARAHGGEIDARSGGLGLGSTFVVRLPALEHIATPVPPENPAGAAGKRLPLSILLLEDHADTADVIGRILRGMGHRVEICHTVQSALATIHGGEFDLVLSDIGLPDGTGIEFIGQAREFTSTPMIALTGYGMEADVATYREAGFLRQLTKPIRFDQLAELLETFTKEGGRQGGLTIRPQPPGRESN